MKKVIIISILLLTSGLASAGMVSNDSIGNDPVKEKLCISRAKIKKTVPFEIDSDYLARARAEHPDATFIAEDQYSPTLIECFLREGTGRFEPDSMSGENWFFHTIKPKRFEPDINTNEGSSIAVHICIKAVESKSDRSKLDHSVYDAVIEANNVIGKCRYCAGTVIAGKKVKRYDVVIHGKSFYKSSGPDLTAIDFTCLLSPMFEIKAIQFK